MNLYTIGFAQKSAEQFFNLIKSNNIELLLDVRLWNSTQLAGFSKGNDLRYFLKTIRDCDYVHALEYAPSKELLDDYKNRKISWTDYETQYRELIKQRNSLETFDFKYSVENICLLCAEPTSEQCHRRLLAEMLAERLENIIIKHI
ncbi:MAG: DUF488 domain-containing protein [Oscillospiraceae bacterium]|nr:DUF488 domain-containing protein [Oscillospiraceae bacterium]